MNRYTNAVLTVIAVALVALVVENAIPLARAQTSGVQHVAICDPYVPSNCANIRGTSESGYNFNAIRVWEH
jgi:hypothetical protein